MLVSAAVCPQPPLLVPDVASGAAEEIADLRAACLAAVRRLTATAPDRVVVVGAATVAGQWGASAGGSLSGHGVAATFGGPDRVLPLSLTIGAFLLDEVGWSGQAQPRGDAQSRRYVAVRSSAGAGDCAELGRRLVAGAERIALLVMGDLSAKRSTSSPGYFDQRAAGYDAEVVAALTRPDIDVLLGLETALADDLWVAGRPAWQVLAGAAQTTYTTDPEGCVTTHLHYDDAPYGVGYVVVDWTVEPATHD